MKEPEYIAPQLYSSLHGNLGGIIAMSNDPQYLIVWCINLLGF